MGSRVALKEVVVSASLKAADGGYAVKVVIDSADHEPVPFDFDLSPRTQGVIRGLEQGIGSGDDIRDIGAQLWDGLLPGLLADEFRQALGSADHLTFELGTPDDLERLPWEAMFDTQLRAYIACHPKVSFVHAGPPRRQPEVAPPARDNPGPMSILVVIPQGAGLNVETESANMRAAVAKLGDAVRLVDMRGVVHPSALRATLESCDWNVVHFIGHGQLVDNRVEVRLNDETGTELWRDADQFTALFQSARIDVCVLNCCYGGSASNVRTLDRLASGLLATGIRSVVAMRYAMADAAAVLFSRMFYGELLAGERPGRVDHAAQLARKALLENAPRDDRRSFITPVVHTAGPQQPLPVPRPSMGIAGGDVHEAHPELVPARLRQAVQERRCVVVVGTDLVPPPATRRGPAMPGLNSLLETLITRVMDGDGDGPVAPDGIDVTLPHADAFLRRIAERYQANDRWPELVELVRDFYAPQQPTEVHRLIGGWAAPAVFYTPFDGLLEASLPALSAVRITRSLTEQIEPADSVVVLVRGTINDYESLVLSEHDHFELAERIERMHASLASLAKPRTSQLRSVLFVGVDPTDVVARQLARRLLAGPLRPETYFVCEKSAGDGECFWKRFRACFVRMDVQAFVRAVSPNRGAA